MIKYRGRPVEIVDWVVGGMIEVVLDDGQVVEVPESEVMVEE